MSNLTENAIRSSFIKLLDKKPLKQITVRSIVEDCGINRNTFYYHFQDIPDLVEHILKDDVDNLILKNPEIRSVEDGISTLLDFVTANKKIVLHIYKSVSRDSFETHLWRLCHYTVSSYLDKRTANIRISDEDRKMILSYMEVFSFGLIMGWLENNLNSDLHDYVHRMCLLKQDDLDSLLEKCEIK